MSEGIVPDEVRLAELQKNLKKAREAPKEHWKRLIKGAVVLSEATKANNKALEYLEKKLPVDQVIKKKLKIIEEESKDGGRDRT